jgi:amino acid transporter
VDSRTQTPIPATILPVIIGIAVLAILPGDALLDLITSGTVFPAVTYGAIVVLYLAVRKGLEHKEGGFSLGRFDTPVAIAALIWSVCALIFILAPAPSITPIVMVGILALIGALYFGYMMIFKREVLDAEPDEVSPALADVAE